MKNIEFLKQFSEFKVPRKEFSQFSRGEYEAHSKNVYSLFTDNGKSNIRMLQVPFCINLWDIPLSSTLHNYSLSQSNRIVSIFNHEERDSHTTPLFSQCSSHQHNYYEFIYIYRGSYTHTINGKTYCYHENQCLLLEPGLYHEDTKCLQNNCTIIFFCISKTFFDYLYTRYLSSDIPNIDTSKNPMLASSGSSTNTYFSVYKPLSSHSIKVTRSLAEQLMTEILENQIGCELVSEGLLYRLIAILFNKDLYYCKRERISLYEQERLHISEELQAYLWSRNGQATRKEITQKFNYCADYLNRLLKRETGWTISKYNQYIALKRAEKFLRESDMSVTDIISELGFENKSFFYRLFEKNTGMTPIAYRKQNSEKTSYFKTHI